MILPKLLQKEEGYIFFNEMLFVENNMKTIFKIEK